MEALYAYDCGLEGSLDSITDMEEIFELWLDDNPRLYGSIPSDIGQLTKLGSFSISNNDMTGSIPTQLGHLTHMEQMWLFGNWFEGEIPTHLGKLKKLQILGLEDNLIQHPVPDQVCDLSLTALSADCAASGDYAMLKCDCCDCCEPPCPIANLPIYNTRHLENTRRSLLESDM